MNPAARQDAATVTAAEMRAIEAAAMASGYGEVDLMEEAGTRLGHAIGGFFPHPGTAVAWPGKGHNGGDALIALRILRDAYGWQIRIRHCFGKSVLAPLTRNQLEAHSNTPSFETDDPAIRYPLVLLDGLLGIGADGSELRGPLLEAGSEINDLRKFHGAIVASVDLPSGMHPDTGISPDHGIRADVTFALGAVKHGLILPQAANAVGSLRLVPIPQLTAAPGPGPQLICPQHTRAFIEPRPFDCHKGMAGRVSILAGSSSYIGAAALCSSGAISAGAGLVTLHIPRSLHSLASSKCAPEIIVKPFDHLEELTGEKADAWLIGCGLGINMDRHLLQFIASCSHLPCVLDADALNLIAHHQSLDLLGPNHLITPHPGEFKRLALDLAMLPPMEAAKAWVRQSSATLLLKGARSIIASREKDIHVNSTGHPGMATAGMGDVLAGVAGALLASGQSTNHAATLATWLCGRAAERAIFHSKENSESLRASHITQNLGGAFHDWKTLSR